MSNEQIIFAFPTPIFHKEYPENAELNQTLSNVIRELSQQHNSDDHRRSHQGGFYTKGDFLDSNLPGIEAFRTLLLDAVKSYITAVTAHEAPGRDPLAGEEIKVWGWGALTREKDYQTPHVHAGSTLSAIYYLDVPQKPEPQGCTDFLTPLDHKEMTFLRNASKTFCRIVPKAGVLVIFPSYCKHYVHPFYGDEERIVIASNVKVTSMIAKS